MLVTVAPALAVVAPTLAVVVPAIAIVGVLGALVGAAKYMNDTADQIENQHALIDAKFADRHLGLSRSDSFDSNAFGSEITSSFGSSSQGNQTSYDQVADREQTRDASDDYDSGPAGPRV